MKKGNNTIILDFVTDYEFISLIAHIGKVGYGEFKLKIKKGKPFQIIEVQKSILLTKEIKSKEDYGD